jgi:alkylated DNA repair protein alkB homolog 1
MASTSLLDPTSREYKRARRHYHKTTKNRAEGIDTDWTPFRAAEKKYKARFPPPDLSDVLDLALLDASRSAEIERTGWKGSADTVQVKEIGLSGGRAANDARVRRAFTITGMPGWYQYPPL